MDHGILTQTVEHAIKYLEPTHLFSTHAVGAFKLDWFSSYRIGRWLKDNVRHLLSIASARLRHRRPRVYELVGLNRFLGEVCMRVDGRCGIIGGLSDFVANTGYMLKISDNTASHRHLNQALLFRKILSHVNSTRRSDFWLAVSTFGKVL